MVLKIERRDHNCWRRISCWVFDIVYLLSVRSSGPAHHTERRRPGTAGSVCNMLVRQSRATLSNSGQPHHCGPCPSVTWPSGHSLAQPPPAPVYRSYFGYNVVSSVTWQYLCEFSPHGGGIHYDVCVTSVIPTGGVWVTFDRVISSGAVTVSPLLLGRALVITQTIFL